MSTLERRYGQLLHAYPASYRKERGDEILATLLEASGQGSSRLSFRDARALLIGGLRARAAYNRRFTTSANIRFAVLLGVALSLTMSAAAFLSDFVSGELYRPTGLVYGPTGWSALLAGLLIGATVVLLWSVPRPVVLGSAVAAAAATSYSVGSAWGVNIEFLVTQLISLAAVVALTGQERRPAPGWLWLIGALAVAAILPAPFEYAFHWPYYWPFLMLALLVVTLAWVGIDARPALALATYLVLFSLPMMLSDLAMGVGNWYADPVMVVVVVFAAVSVWRLRRQSVKAVQ